MVYGNATEDQANAGLTSPFFRYARPHAGAKAENEKAR
jgi:hypothetical protein